MEKLFGKFVLAYALYFLGMSLTEVLVCRTGPCLRKIEKAKRDVLHINWKPISLFPEEARKFR